MLSENSGCGKFEFHLICSIIHLSPVYWQVLELEVPWLKDTLLTQGKMFYFTSSLICQFMCTQVFTSSLRQVLHYIVTWWLLLSAVPGASPINRRQIKKREHSLLQRSWKDLDMNGIVLTRRFCQTLALFITCHLTPATLCLSKAIKQVSQAARVPCDTKQMPSVILYLRLLGEMEWGNAAPLTWCAHAEKCFHVHAAILIFFKHTQAHPNL